MNTDEAAFPGKIFVSTDFSEASTAIFPYAVDLAQSSKSELELVHILEGTVIPFAISEYLPSPDEIHKICAEAKSRAEEKLQAIAKEHFSNMSISALVLDRVGPAADAIIERARQGHHGLIVIGTHGYGLLGRAIRLGSVAERVLRHTPCPTLVIPNRAEQGKRSGSHLPFRRIMVTTDLSEPSKAAISVARHEAKRTGADLTVVHIIESPLPPELFGPPTPVTDQKIEEIMQRYRSGIEERLKAFVQSIQDVKVSSTIVDKTYSVANSITEYARAHTVDLIIMATKGSGNRINILGGMAEGVLREAPCPVLVVPPKVS